VITTGSNNVVIGSGSDPSAADGSNQIVVGYGATGQDNNSVTLGNADVTAVYMAQDAGATVHAAGITLSSDAAVINLGVHGDVTITHDADDGIELKSVATADDNPVLLTLQSGETDIEADDVIGAINFQAPDEGEGTDAILVAAGIEAVSEGDFSATSNATKLSFKTGASETATEKMSLSSTGVLTLSNGESISNVTDGTVILNGEVAAGTGGATGIFKSNGDYDVTLKTGNSTTGSITITDGADGDITIAPNGTGKADFNDSPLTGFGAYISAESGTSKTLAAADNGTIINCSSGSAVAITVPASLPTGFNCMIVQSGSGQVSLTASSTTLNNKNGIKTSGQYAIMTLVHLGSNVFVVSGDTSSS
jgi:hypothetical protein